MSYNFREYDQDQLLLMPPSVREWVKEDSMACFLSEIVDGFDARGRLAGFYAVYRGDGWGAPAFHPVLMLKVLLYAYTNGSRVRAGSPRRWRWTWRSGTWRRTTSTPAPATSRRPSGS